MCTITILLFSSFANPEGVVSENLHNRCLSQLHEALTHGEEFVKVHAAESLLWTGHPESVREVFLSEPETLPRYRIGVWRVLAQAAPDSTERESYQGNILTVLLDKNAPDRTHAAETLGKLGFTSRDPEIVRASKDETGPFLAMVRWVLANSGEEEDEQSLAELLESSDAYTRGCAAYALRFFKTIRPATLKQLKSAAEKEPPDSAWLAHMISAQYLHASGTERPVLHERLLQCLQTGDPGQKREVCAALGRVPHPSDVPLLKKVLEDSDLDVRAGAAEAILLIERSLKK